MFWSRNGAARTDEGVCAYACEIQSSREPIRMRITSRRRTIAFFVTLGVCLVTLAVALNVGWIILNWREGVMLFLGVIFFGVLMPG